MERYPPPEAVFVVVLSCKRQIPPKAVPKAQFFGKLIPISTN